MADSFIRRLRFDFSKAFEGDQTITSTYNENPSNRFSMKENVRSPSDFTLHEEEGSRYGISEMVEDVIESDIGWDEYTKEDFSNKDADIKPQKLDNFTAIRDDEKVKIRFETDAATKILSKSIREENKMITAKIHIALNKSEEDGIDMDDFIQYFFGTQSEMTTVFLHHLGIDYLTFLKWISTILILQSYRLSISLLHDTNGIIDKKIIDVSTLFVHRLLLKTKTHHCVIIDFSE